MPPPMTCPLLVTVLPETVLLVTVNVPPLKMPPPLAPPVLATVALPPVIVSPDNAAVTPLLTLNTRLALFPEMVNTSAAGPWIIRFLEITNSPLVSVIGLAKPGVKVIVLPGQALLMVARREPAPLSLLLVTTVGPQLTVIVAVAVLPPRPLLVLFKEACTWKLPAALELFAGVNFNPALPSATVMKSLLFICVVPSFLKSLPLVMPVILKLVTSGPSAGLIVMTRPDVVCVLTVVV